MVGQGWVETGCVDCIMTAVCTVASTMEVWTQHKCELHILTWTA